MWFIGYFGFSYGIGAFFATFLLVADFIFLISLGVLSPPPTPPARWEFVYIGFLNQNRGFP